MVPYKAVFQALEASGVRYLVAGGVALNLHQIARLTVDLDLIVHLETSNVQKFVRAMTGLGFRPKVPVDPMDFADPARREAWIAEKGMIVFSFVNPNNPMEIVDIFVREPKPFEAMYARRVEVRVFETVIPILSIADLRALKEEAGRPKDLYDIKLLKEREEDEERR